MLITLDNGKYLLLRAYLFTQSISLQTEFLVLKAVPMRLRGSRTKIKFLTLEDGTIFYVTKYISIYVFLVLCIVNFFFYNIKKILSLKL